MDILVKPSGNIHVADWGAGPRQCAVGRSGIGVKLREGDGITPIGRWPLRQVFYRADRIEPPKTCLPMAPISESDAWCDQPESQQYNRLVRLEGEASEERLWRTDSLYDVIVVVGFNDAPVVQGAGSAIFIHLAQPEFRSTAGCIAFRGADLLEALSQLGPEDQLVVEA